ISYAVGIGHLADWRRSVEAVIVGNGVAAGAGPDDQFIADVVEIAAADEEVVVATEPVKGNVRAELSVRSGESVVAVVAQNLKLFERVVEDGDAAGTLLEEGAESLADAD